MDFLKYINLHRLTDIGHNRNSVSKVCSDSSGNYGKLCSKTPEGDNERFTGVREPSKRAERPVRTWKLSRATTGKLDIQKNALSRSLCRRAQPPLQATKVSTQSKATARRSIVTRNMDGVFYKNLPDVSQLLALILVEGLTDVCWKLNTAEKRWCRKSLQSVEENSPTQLVSEPTRGATVYK